MNKSVVILGQEYKIRELTEKEYPKLKDNSGLFEGFSKELILDKETLNIPDEMSWANLGEFKNKVLRHEIVHAFFMESGLKHYMDDEKLVDYLAYQLPKMFKVCKELGIEK